MSAINPIYFDRVRYTLFHPELGSEEIQEPVGWETDEKEYSRHETYSGIFTKFSNNLKFVGDGAAFITMVYEVFGIETDIRLVRDEKHPDTDQWERSYDGYLDLSTYVLENGQVSIKFNASGIEQQLKAREGEAIDVERITDLNGNPIGGLRTQNIILDSRRIFLSSLLESTGYNNKAQTDISSNAGNTRDQTVCFPLRISANSHQGTITDTAPETRGTETKGQLGLMFLFDIDRVRTFNVQVSATFDLFVQQYENIEYAYAQVCLTTYKDGFDFNLKEGGRRVLYDLQDNHPWFGRRYNVAMPQILKEGIKISHSEAITLLPGESLALELYVKADFYRDNNAGLRVYAQNIESSVALNEDSDYKETTGNIVLVHEMGERISEIITGKKVFKSEALGRTELGYDEDGIASLMGITHGFWIRGFEKFPDTDENKYQSLSISFKEYMDSLYAIWNLGLGIERIGYRETIRIEPQSYFFNNNVLIRLPYPVKKVKRSIATEYYYSGIEVGYSKGGEYEEAMGLDEYNAKANFTTNITRVKNVFQAISPIRTDSYGKEFARRKPKTDDPTADTRYDQDNFAIDLKRSGFNFVERTWQDDFAQKPTGVFSPDSAQNLRFSPVNMLLRHGWEINAGLTKYPNEYIRFGSSTANSKLRTQLIGKEAYQENGDIPNSELTRARYVPEWVEFEHPVDFSLIKEIEGSTEINGKQVPNFYGLVEFTNERGDQEKGFLFNVKPNGEGKWRLLKANR